YRVENIGYADDFADADGEKVLTFWQAQEKARAMNEKPIRTDPAHYTVRQAIADYIVSLDGKPTQYSAKFRLAAYVPDALADKPVAEVTVQDLETWQRDITKLPPRAHTAKGAAIQNYRQVDMSDPEVQRQRRSSAKRIMTNLGAALNLAFKHGKVPSDSVWRRVKRFKGADAARLRYLSIVEAKRLINACDPDFRPLAQAALLTGARYSELTRLQVQD